MTALRPLNTLAPAEKACMPVSVALDEDGTEIVVSRYEDAVWDFWPSIRRENAPSCNKRLDWRAALPDGSRLTDAQHAGLLTSAKDFIWSLFQEPIEGRQRRAPVSLIHAWTNLVPLLRWMVNQGMTRFAQLEGRTLSYVPVARQGQAGRPVSRDRHYARLVLLEDLYAQRAKLHDALPTAPWPHESARSLAGLRGLSRQTPKTQRIPERVARALARCALHYVEHQAQRLLDARDAIAAAQAAAMQRGRKTAFEILRLRAARRQGFQGAREVAEELVRLRTACYIVIGLFSGIRDSELLALESNCIRHAKSRDGSVEVTWLQGIIYKTGRRAHQWLVPSVVETAVRVLERYSEPYRSALQSERAGLEARLAQTELGAQERHRLVRRLHSARTQAHKLFLCRDYITNTIQVINSGAMSRRLKEFCEHFDILGDDGTPWALASHQFRRTYAYFVASSEMGDLHYLREHFGHWSLDMTLLYADGATDEFELDGGLLDAITQTKAERQEAILSRYMTGEVPLANGADWLGEWRRLVRTAQNRDELIRELSGTLTLNGTGHSWCVGNARGTGCGGLCVFEADMCVDCQYGIIGPEHLPVWQEIARQQEMVLAMADLGRPGRVRAERILRKAREVIRRLEERP